MKSRPLCCLLASSVFLLLTASTLHANTVVHGPVAGASEVEVLIEDSGDRGVVADFCGMFGPGLPFWDGSSLPLPGPSGGSLPAELPAPLFGPPQGGLLDGAFQGLSRAKPWIGELNGSGLATGFGATIAKDVCYGLDLEVKAGFSITEEGSGDPFGAIGLQKSGPVDLFWGINQDGQFVFVASVKL